MLTTLICPAKVNLFLAIHGQDETGYHFVETVMARNYSMVDQIHLDEAPRLRVECPGVDMEDNLVTKAVSLLEEESGRSLPYSIQIEKEIPMQSGLGGGSSDAAAVMVFINEHQGLGISHMDLVELGAKVGMDVPFFITGSPVALCTHYGEVITGLPNLPKDIEIEIRKGDHQSTQDAYIEWDKHGKKGSQNSQKLQDALLNEDSQAILKELHNDFQTIFPLPQFLEQSSSSRALLSGSGGAYAVFRVKNTQQ